jgi:hypothetical protein
MQYLLTQEEYERIAPARAAFDARVKEEVDLKLNEKRLAVRQLISDFAKENSDRFGYSSIYERIRLLANSLDEALDNKFVTRTTRS